MTHWSKCVTHLFRRVDIKLLSQTDLGYIVYYHIYSNNLIFLITFVRRLAKVNDQDRQIMPVTIT